MGSTSKKITKTQKFSKKKVGKGVIYTGDCLVILQKEIPSETINLIFADPPYNLSGRGLKLKNSKTGGDWYMVNEDWDKMREVEYLKFTEDWIKKSFDCLVRGGNFFVSSTYHNLGEILTVFKKVGLKTRNIITWYKPNAMPNVTKRTLTHATEFIVWGTKGKGWVFNYKVSKDINPLKTREGKPKQMRDLWEIPLCQGKERVRGKNGRALHPTQKPEELLKRIILIASNEDDLVLDPFLGSGTTAVIAERYNRNWIGIEINERYIAAALKRIKQEVSTLSLFRKQT